MANEKTPVVWDDTTKKHRPLGSGEKMGGLSASSMISFDSGNLLQQGSDGLMLVTGGSIADPRADNLLEESENGKLQVTTERVVEWLDGHPQAAAAIADAVKVVSEDSGNVIVQGSDKGAYLAKGAISAAVSTMTDAQKNQLADAISPRIASDIADGQTVTVSNGKLHFDPTNATAAQKQAINQALADQTSGLVVDSSTGRMKVDFSNMPTDKFEALLKSLNMLVPLTQNMNLYVSASSDGDSIVDGRGTQAKPFKTIQACVNYATETYSIGRFNINVNIAAGVYNESVSLPDYSYGTGRIVLRPTSGARDVEIAAVTNSYGTRKPCIYVSGGAWVLRNLILSRVENPTTEQNVSTGCLVAFGGSSVNVSGIAFRQSYPASPSPLGGVPYSIRLVWCGDGSSIVFSHGSVAHAFSSQKAAGGNSTYCIFVSNQGRVVLNITPSTDVSHNVECSGTFDVFALATNGASFVPSGSGNTLVFNGAGCEGKRYEVTGGSFINTNTNDSTYFPGDVEGTVSSSTYCWYA